MIIKSASLCVFLGDLIHADVLVAAFHESRFVAQGDEYLLGFKALKAGSGKFFLV
jgi:hypothetical protein